MQQMSFDNLLTMLSLLVASPENYIQINSQNVDVSDLARTGTNDAICRIQEMSNLSDLVDTALKNEMKMKDKINKLLLHIKPLAKILSVSPNSTSCDKQQKGEALIMLPNLPFAFPVWCTTNKYGENWLLIASRNVNSKLFSNTTTELAENSIGDFKGEYFIGFKKLRAITESYLCELLIVQYNIWADEMFYDHYEAFAIGSDNKVKVLGLHKTNDSRLWSGLTAHLQKVNDLLLLNPKVEDLSTFFIRIYLRRVTLDTIPQLKNT